MTDKLVHAVAWKVGVSRGTYCGLISHDPPVMQSLMGQAPTNPPYPPWASTMNAKNVTCEKCIAARNEGTAQAVDEVLTK